MWRRLPCLLVAGLALGLPAAAPAAGVTKKALTFDVVTGPQDDAHCSVTADLYTPSGASKADPAPAVLATNGFGGSKADFGDLGPAYAKRGYVFLAYSGLGFGGSGCKIQLDDPQWDGKAGSQLVSFLAGTKAATDGTTIDYVALDGPGDPRVGMIGGSYGGQIQFAIAGVDQRLDALVPQITWNDLSYSLTPNNTDFTSGVSSATPGVSKLDWPVLFTGLGVGQGIQQSFSDPSHLGACPNFDDQVCPSLVQSGAAGYPDAATIAFLRRVSVATYVDRIKVPTFLIQGQSDTLFNLQESVATWRALRDRGVPVKLLWRSAGHSGGGLGAQESSESALEGSYESRMALEWLDFWLRGLGDAPTLDFSFLRDWALPAKGDAAPAVGQTPAYPAATDEVLHLSGDGTLTGGAGAEGGMDLLAQPVGLTGSGNAAIVQPPAPDAPATSASFTSAPLPGDVDVVGVPRLTVRLDAPTFAGTQGTDPGGKLVLFARLEDVDEAGAATLPRNLLSSVRVADVTKPVDVELPGIAHRFAKGHRLRLVLATSNATSRGNLVTGPVRVLTPGTLALPRLGAPAGAAGSGPSGTTPFTPPAGSPALRRATRPAFAARGAATLPAARSCSSRRAFRIRLRRAPKGDRIRSAVVTVNGKRVRTLRGRRVTARVDLRGLPKGTFRVAITVRTKKGRVLRSARTYRTCVRRS